MPGILSRIAELACRGAGATAAYIERIDASRNEVQVIATAGEAAPAVGVRVPYPGSLAEQVLQSADPEVVRAEELARRPIGSALARGACRGCDALVLPLLSDGDPLGALILLGESMPAPEDPRPLRALADMAGLSFRHTLLLDHMALQARALKESERRFRLLVESVEDYAIFMLDPEGRIATWNRGAERIKGYGAEEVLGRHFSLFYTEEDRDRGWPQQVLETAARSGKVEHEGWRVRKDGSRIWAHVIVTAIRDEAGELWGFTKLTRDLTLRRKGETELRESEERFRQLADNVREVFWLFEGSFSRLIYLSPAFEEVWERPLASAFERPDPWIDWVHPEDRTRAIDFAEALRRGPADTEYRIVRPSGETRWVWVRGFVLHDEEGAVRRIGGVTEDITERKEIERRHLFLLEASRVLASSLDYRKTLSRVAQLAVPDVGDWCAVDMLEGKDGLRRIAVAHRDPAKARAARALRRRYPPDLESPVGIGKVMRTGEPELIPEISEGFLEQIAHDAEHLALLRDLGLRSAMIVPLTARGRILGSITFVVSESGRRYGQDDLVFAEELAGRAALAVDNTLLHRRTEEARAEAERRAVEEAALQRAMHAVTAAFSVEEVIHRVAESSLAATGADGAFVSRIEVEAGETHVVAATGSVASAAGIRQPYRGSLTQTVIERGKPLAMTDLTGALGPLSEELAEACGACSAVAVPLIDAGEAIGTLVLTRGPGRPEFRPDEIERARSFADLAALAFRKIHLLQDAEGRREEVERLLEGRTRLIRGFSHDVRNALGAASAHLDLIVEGIVTEPDKQRSGMSRARRAIASAAGLIDKLIELAMAETGQVEVSARPVDVREVAREIVGEYRGHARAKGLEIALQAPEQLPLIESDPDRIRQILGNLLSNAVKYTPDGWIRAGVAERDGAEGGPAPGRWIAVDVVDTGPGIPPEKHGLLFREFSRLHEGDQQGAGLGLAISQLVAQALGGLITVKSAPGEGSTFTLWLPLRELRSAERRDDEPRDAEREA